MVLRIDHRQDCSGSRGWCALLGLTVGKPAENGDAIGLGPKAHHAGFREGRILNDEQWLTVEEDVEAGAGELNAQRVPLVGGYSGLHAVAAFLADEVERSAHTVHGLV